MGYFSAIYQLVFAKVARETDGNVAKLIEMEPINQPRGQRSSEL